MITSPTTVRSYNRDSKPNTHDTNPQINAAAGYANQNLKG